MQNITLTLTLNEVNAIMAALGNMPYAQVFEVVKKVSEQAAPQVQAQAAAEENADG